MEMFCSFARNNQWSNARLYAALSILPEAELVATRVSFFGSIVATLQHIVAVDRRYLDRLRGHNPLPDAYNHPPQTLPALHALQRRADRELVTLCQGAGAEGFRRRVSYVGHDGPRTESVANLLSHLFVHQIHHRGQVHDMMSATTVAPPQLDEFFLDSDWPLRAAEIEAIRAGEG